MSDYTVKESSTVKKDMDFFKQSLEQKTKELRIFVEAGKALTSSLNVNDILNIIIEKAEQLVSCDDWALFFLDEDQKELKIELSRYKSAEDLHQGNHVNLKMGEGGAGWVAEHRKPLLVENIKEDPRSFSELNLFALGEVKSILSVPISIRDVTIGVFEMCSKDGFDDLNPERMDLLIQLVDHAAIAIDKAKLYQRMEEITITDDLTQLYNMRYMDKHLEHEIRRCQRYSSSIGSIFLDLDYFKNVNDQHGHRMGSKVLQEVAVILNRHLRDVDIVARFGGDEFVIILPEVDIDATEKIAERLRGAISRNAFLSEEHLNLTITASFGVSGYPYPAINKVDLIDSADKAMYDAKNSGRNKVCRVGDV